MCCIPLGLEFHGSHCLVNLFVAGGPCWSSGAGAFCFDSHVSLPRVQLYHPCQRARLSNLLWFALCGFCSVKAFCSALEDENENGSLSISGPRAESLGPHSSVCPPGRAGNHSISLVSVRTLCSPVLWQSVSISGMRPQLWVSKPCRLLWCSPVLLLPGEEGRSH